MKPLRSPASEAGVRRTVTVVLAGRQNAGKTSVLMHLTGSAQRPVNFPGSSVERAESSVILGDTRLRGVDLPGIGSLSAISRDEALAIGFLRGDTGDKADVLCAVMDAAKLTVELHLLAKLMRLGLPVVVALTKNDVARAEGRAVDAVALQTAVGVPVWEVNALTGEGMDALRDGLLAAAGAAPPAPLTADPDAIARAVQAEPGAGARSVTDRIDQVLLHPWLGLPIVALIMFGVFQLIFAGADPFIGLIEQGQGALAEQVAGLIPAGALQSLVIDGVINGLGSIVVFLPQIILLMTLVALLEASGYMARAAFLLDRVLRRFGLSGRSFVPMVSAFACAVPAVLSTRIIDNERDRLATMVVLPLMSCSARLPVYVVLIGAFFPVRWAGLVLFGMYSLGIVIAVLVAWALRRSALRGTHSALMMELPAYQRPSGRVVFAQVRSAVREFMVLAGTVIFATAVVIWALSYYPRPAGIHAAFEERREAVIAAGPAEQDAMLASIDNAERAAYLEQSWLAGMGKAVQPVFEPAGFDWRITVGILAAFPARELILPTLGVLYSVGDVDPGAYDIASLESAGEPDGLREMLRASVRPDGSRSFTPLVALGVMVFFALCSQCMGTLAAIRRESRSWRWPLFTFAYMTLLAWVAAVAVHLVGTALGLGA